MKKFVWILLILSSTLASGQTSGTLPSAAQPSFDIAEQLVLMAWRNDPGLVAFQRNVNAAEYAVKLSNVEWLNLFSFTGNLNEFNINPEADNFNRSQFFPRYNFRAVIPFGTFFSIPYTTKRNRELLFVAEANVAGEREVLKGQVLRAYNNYLMYKKVYEMRVETTLDSENKLKLGEQKFRTGDISFDEYSMIRNGYGEAQVSLYVAEAAYKNSIVNLEELVGVPLDEYLQQTLR